MNFFSIHLKIENDVLTTNLDENHNSEIISTIETTASSELTEELTEHNETKTSVRKLSLFDTIEEQSSSESVTNIYKEQKKEPMFENQLEDVSATSEEKRTEKALDSEEIET